MKKKPLSLAKAFRLNRSRPQHIAFVGAGGKTTALFQVAREHSPCIVTTTTHLGAWQAKNADEHLVIRNIEEVNSLEKITFNGVILVTGGEKNRRLLAPSQEVLSKLREFAEDHSLPIFIEADGARQKSLKAPKENEPVIPDFVDTVVVVAGLSGIGMNLNDAVVYNAKGFSKSAKMGREEKINSENLATVLTDKTGGLKNIPQKARRIALLTQADTSEQKSMGGKIAGKLLTEYDSVLVANLQAHHLQAFTSASAIILAAGSSSRFGEAKQLLDYHGVPFIHAVVEKALQAELSPIVVVTGAEDAEIRVILEGLPVKIVKNEDWRGGQSSSIRAGVEILPPNTGSAIFLLADQPQVTPTVMRALVEEHRRTLNPIIAPMVEDRRATPVLFDRVTFPALLKLKGDIGGRGIFSQFSPSYLPWLDSALLLDVDSPEDYEKLLNL